MSMKETRSGGSFRLIGCYVWWVAPDGKRKQICEGGEFSGNTVTANEGTFEKEVAKWRRQRRAILGRM